MHTVTVDVTEQDLTAGRASREGRCPLEIAILRATGREDVHVGHHYALLGVPGTPEAVMARLPPEATHFAQAWERRYAKGAPILAPIRFELIVPRARALAERRRDRETPLDATR